MLAMASSEGLDAAAGAEIQKEFKELDKNGDGRLDAGELGATLSEAGLPPGSMAAPQVSAQQGQPLFQQAAAPVAPAAQAAAPVAAQAALTPAASAGAAPLPSAATIVGGTPSDDAAALLQQMQAIEGQVFDRARRRTAEIFSAQASSSLEHKSKDEQGAAALSNLAKKLWSNATSLLSRAPMVTATAARDAASNIIRKALTEVKDLDAKSKKASAAAQAKRQAAQASMQAAMAAQRGASENLRLLQSRAQSEVPAASEQQLLFGSWN